LRRPARAAPTERGHGQPRQAAQGTQEAEAAEEAGRLTRPSARGARTQPSTRVGLVSDTHGLLRPQALDALRGSDAIVHAGDIGAHAILDALAAIAPVTAVRGNNDHGTWAAGIPDDAVLTVDGVSIYVIHDLATMTLDPVALGHRVVVSGHSHRPSCVERDGVWYVNPGSAGPRRFTLPITVAELVIREAHVQPRLIELRI
jgi:putative phosphoesterase